MQGRQWRVVVADDNRTNQIVLTHILRSSGFNPYVVSAGDAVLEELGRDTPVDAVLIDISMPEISGLDTIKLIRIAEIGDTTVSRTPIVAITADDQRKTREECLAAGADEFLVQPVTSVRLVETLKTLISEREQSFAALGEAPDVEGGRARLGLVVSNPVSLEVLQDLEDVGGVPFIASLINAFKTDVEINFNYLKESIINKDVVDFRERVMGVFSSSATLGGRAIKNVYDHAMTMSEQHFSWIAPLILARLQFEVRRLIKAIEDYIEVRSSNPNTVIELHPKR